MWVAALEHQRDNPAMTDPFSNCSDNLPRPEAPRYRGYLGFSGAYTLAGTLWQLGRGDGGVAANGKPRELRCVPLTLIGACRELQSTITACCGWI